MDWGNLKADYERLGTYKAVAAEYGVSVSSVGDHAREQHVNRGYAGGSSPLEKLLQSALRKAGLGFTAQAFVGGRYFADTLLNQAPVIIEADGHWHKMRKAEDAKRDAALTAAGYRVFRFDGAQLNRGADECIRQVTETCGLVPDEDPQYVIRTSMMGAENPNWNGGPQAIACAQCGAEAQRNKFRIQFSRMFCNKECYGAWMRAHPEKSNRRYDIDWQEVAALYRDGSEPTDIMKRFGIAKTTLYRKLRELGVEMRRKPKAPFVSKFTDEARANLRAGWEKRRSGGKAPAQGQDGRFTSSRCLAETR